MTLSIMALGKATSSIMTLDILTLRIMTRCIITLSISTISITLNAEWCYSDSRFLLLC
jgi:hypothetical protein